MTMRLFRASPNHGSLSAEEAAARLPIWSAFAELFLDTEQQPQDYRRIATTISGRGFDQAQLLAILGDEVAPAFAHNIFLDIAGEWAGWPEDYVLERVSATLKSGPSWLLPSGQIAAYVDEEWRKIQAYLA